MTEFPGFNVLLTRLADHRELSVEQLSHLSSVPEDELRAVLDGEAPSHYVLRGLASAFQLHAEDLFVMADVALPVEMAPLDHQAGSRVAVLTWRTERLSAPGRGRLLQQARALPQEERTQPPFEPPAYMHYPPGFGGLLMRMLANRNLGWLSGAKVFHPLTGRYWSAATYGAVGRGRMKLSPDLLADYATVLGIRADDLSALTGIKLPDDTPPPSPVQVDIVDLVWEARRLTENQVKLLVDCAEAAVLAERESQT